MSCNRFYKLVCYRNEEVEDTQCCGASKTGHKYLNGVAMYSNGKLIHMIERPYHVSEIGGIVTIKDAFETEVTFKASQTVYSLNELIQILGECNQSIAGVPVFNIGSDQVTDNGDGTFSIDVDNPVEGAMAFDENGNVYEFDGSVWTLKSSFPTKLSEFQNDVPFVESVVPGDNVTVDNTDPKKPVVEADNIYSEDGTLSENRVIDLGSNNLKIIQNHLGNNLSLQSGPAGSFKLFSQHQDGELFGFNISLIAKFMAFFTGQDYLSMNPAKNWFLKLDPTSGVVAFEEVSADNLFTKDLVLQDHRHHDLSDKSFVVETNGTGTFRIKNSNKTDGDSLYIGGGHVSLTQEDDFGNVTGFDSADFGGGFMTFVIYTGQSSLKSSEKYLIKDGAVTKYGAINIPEYASDTAADNDSELVSGAPYSVTGNRTVKRKP